MRGGRRENEELWAISELGNWGWGISGRKARDQENFSKIKCVTC